MVRELKRRSTPWTKVEIQENVMLPGRKKPVQIMSVNGEVRVRSYNVDGTLRKLRKGRKTTISLNPNPDPVLRAKRLEYNRKMHERFRAIRDLSNGEINPYRKGVFDGHNKESAKVYWATAQAEAKQIMKYLKENDMVETPENDKYASMAEEALEAAITVVRTPINQQTKLTAARLVLDFTKSKPASKQEVNVKTAEDWLSNVLADSKK